MLIGMWNAQLCGQRSYQKLNGFGRISCVDAVVKKRLVDAVLLEVKKKAKKWLESKIK